MDTSRGLPLIEKQALNALLRWRRKYSKDPDNSLDAFTDMLVKADRLAKHRANLSYIVRKIKRMYPSPLAKKG